MSASIPYQKPYLSSHELCKKLSEDGLIISDEDLASKTLERCSYYRFKAYLVPMKNPQGGFIKGATFEKAIRLYDFDEKLRALLFSFIQQTEIALRSSFDDWMTNNNEKNAFWYLDASLFENKDKHTRTITGIVSSFRKSKEPFADHFRSKYHNSFCSFYRDLPPGWVATELLTFGQFKSLLEAISKKAAQDSKLNRYADKITGVKDFKSLINWLNVINPIRNVCCHHSRLFNRNLPSPVNFKHYLDPSIPLIKVANTNKEQNNRLYSALVAIQQLQKSMGFENIGPKIQELITSHPEVQIHLPSMGFPERWRDESHFGF